MELKIEIIESKSVWEGFMDLCKPPSFLHSWAWGEFNGKMGNKVFRFGVFNGGDLIAAALVFHVPARKGSFLFCPHGPIILDKALSADILGILTAHLTGIARKEGCAYIRFSPLMELSDDNEKIFTDLKLRQAPIHMQHPELSWLLDVTLPEDELLRNMRKTTRYCIKKAEKDGVEIEMSSKPEDVEVFWNIYRETFGRQHFTPFSKAYMRNEMEVFGKDDGVLLFFAKYNSDVVATAMIVFYQGSAFYHHGASIHKYPKITAPYLLQWAVIKEAKRRGCKWYNFWGVVGDDQPKHPWAGLSLFKKGFGGFSQAYVHAKDLVITPIYWLSFIVEVIRRKKRGL